MRLLAALVVALTLVAPAQAQVSPVLDERFGVILTGSTEDGQNAATVAPEVLGRLGAKTWYSFTNDDLQIPGTVRVQLARPTSTPDELAARAALNPGSTWLMGNEPNVPGQDDILPELFATWYHDSVAAIRAVDPSAKFVGPNGLNWDFTCTACAGYMSFHMWADLFVMAYQAAYGEYPPMDAWGIHVYDVDWANPPLVHTQRSFDQMEGLRAWLDAQPQLAGKPIWLSEFGVIFGYDSYQLGWRDGVSVLAPSGPWRGDVVESYVRDMTSWLVTRGTELGVARWYLYSTLPSREPYQAEPAGIALLNGPAGSLRLTNEALLYLAPARPPAAS